MIHDLVNAGTADIVFTTVEFLDSAERAAAAAPRRTRMKSAPFGYHAPATIDEAVALLEPAGTSRCWPAVRA